MSIDDNSSKKISSSNNSFFSFSPDITDEELAFDWTLSEEDKQLIFQCRGEDNLRRFAVQLCTLRKYGCFLEDYTAIPTKIISYLSQQIEINPILYLTQPTRNKTELYYQQKISQYLGYTEFNPIDQQNLQAWIYKQFYTYAHPQELLEKTQQYLRQQKILPPPLTTLERLVKDCCNNAEDEIFENIAKKIPPEICNFIDQILEVGETDYKSTLFQLSEYPPEASPKTILSYIEKYRLIEAQKIDCLDFSDLSPSLLNFFWQTIKTRTTWAIKRFVPSKKYALVSVFLSESKKIILDHIIQMHDRLLTTMLRHSKIAYEQEHRKLRHKVKKGTDVLVELAKAILSVENPQSTPVAALYEDFSEASILNAIESCNEFRDLEDSGVIAKIDNRYSFIRRYFPAFLTLPFKAALGTEHLLHSIEIVKKLDSSEIKHLPDDVPTDFVPSAWKKMLMNKDGTINRRIWEIALAFSMKEALLSADLFLPESRTHKSFWNLLYQEEKWKEEKQTAYTNLSLPNKFDSLLQRLKQDFDLVAKNAEDSLQNNPFAEIIDGKLKLKREDAIILPPTVKPLSRLIEASLPKVRIERLLQEVDDACNFTRALKSKDNQIPRTQNHYSTLLAALVAHGTNLGIVAMGHSTDSITVDMLQQVSRYYLTEQALREANSILVNYLKSLPTSLNWGNTTISSSDGQRFGIRRSSLLASFYPRYFGYYDRAITIYTHLSDQHSVFSTQAICCAERKALYVLDGLLANDTVLGIKEHHTDTHGFTEQLFGLCYLLGYSFMPRISHLHKQDLYKLYKQDNYGNIDVLFDSAIDLDLLKEQWDSLVRVVASLKNKVVPASVIMQRLVNGTDRLSKALTSLGRIVKTSYLLRYISDEKVRRQVQLHLNRGELRHFLAKHLFFANQGVFRTGDLAEIMNKATCLSILSNAVVVWNVIEIGKILHTLHKDKQIFDSQSIAHISPLLFSHIIPNGTYNFSSNNSLVKIY